MSTLNAIPDWGIMCAMATVLVLWWQRHRQDGQS